MLEEEKNLKFTQIVSGRWNRQTEDGKLLKGYTLFALGEDGVVYKHHYRKGADGGWVPLPSTILPMPEAITQEAPSPEAIAGLVA